MLLYNIELKQHARQLRTNMTDAEKRLWLMIRMKKLRGYQFYRQKPIGEYIVDFYCPKAKLIIEVDSGQHFYDEEIRNDRIRDKYIKNLGLKVLRFSNSDVMNNIEGVVESIEREIPLNPPFTKGEI